MINDVIITLQLTLPFTHIAEPEQEQCLWCGRVIPAGHICLHETNMAFVYIATPGMPPIGQCAWCGLITSGPHAGKYAMTHNGYGSLVPDLAMGESHGICLECAGRFATRKTGITSQ